jgi:hypothetical protein
MGIKLNSEDTKLFALAVAAYAATAGMEAENKFQDMRGYALAYSEMDFYNHEAIKALREALGQ